MELPINDKELATIISAMRLGGDGALYQKLKNIQEVRNENPGGAYKKSYVNNTGWLPNGFIERNCQGDWR